MKCIKLQGTRYIYSHDAVIKGTLLFNVCRYTYQKIVVNKQKYIERSAADL